MEDDFLWNFGHLFFRHVQFQRCIFFILRKHVISHDITTFRGENTCCTWSWHRLDILTQNHQRVAIPWVPWAAKYNSFKILMTHGVWSWQGHWVHNNPAWQWEIHGFPVRTWPKHGGCSISMWVWMNIPGCHLVWQPTAWLVTMGHVNFHISFFWRDYTCSEWISCLKGVFFDLL